MSSNTTSNGKQKREARKDRKARSRRVRNEVKEPTSPGRSNLMYMRRQKASEEAMIRRQRAFRAWLLNQDEATREELNKKSWASMMSILSKSNGIELLGPKQAFGVVVEQDQILIHEGYTGLLFSYVPTLTATGPRAFRKEHKKMWDMLIRALMEAGPLGLDRKRTLIVVQRGISPGKNWKYQKCDVVEWIQSNMDNDAYKGATGQSSWARQQLDASHPALPAWVCSVPGVPKWAEKKQGGLVEVSS